MKRLCDTCGTTTANIALARVDKQLCRHCFFIYFEETVHKTIVEDYLFCPGDTVAIGASGGKDSTVLAYVLKHLNERYHYGLKLLLLSVDEGIQGYRDDSLKTVQENHVDYNLPLYTVSYSELYEWTMDQVVAQIGKKSNCTFCGVFRRQALEKGAEKIGANVLATGHNADDIAETVLLNLLRGDHARLSRCIEESHGFEKWRENDEKSIRRVKPLRRVYEKEIVMYAYFKKLKYFSTECIYAPFAYRGHAREYIKNMERIRPSCISDILYSISCLNMNVEEEESGAQRNKCVRCGSISSQEVCKACLLKESLDKGEGKLATKRAGMSTLLKHSFETSSQNE
eukprot:jgi/Galph1/6031/GphlegSOOS_G4701.1